MTEETLLDVWLRMKPFINKNDVLNAADTFVSSLDENGLLDISEHAVLTIEDPVLKDALVSYYEIELDSGEEEYE